MKKIVQILILLFFSTAISQSYTNELKSISQFEQLSSPPLVEKYGQVSAIKIMYDLKRSKMYYINGNRYAFHYEFATGVLGFQEDNITFNKNNYSPNPNRRFLLGNLIYYEFMDRFALEISPIDLMETQDVLDLRTALIDSSFLDDQFAILLSTPGLQTKEEELAQHSPLLKPEDIYANLSFQAIGKFKECGRIKLIENIEKQWDEINPEDIILISNTPLLLPEVSGVLVQEFQTPLSHLSLLAQNRKIPVAAIKGLFEQTDIMKLEDKDVCLQVNAENYLLEEKPTKSWDKKNKRKKRIRLDYDLKKIGLIDLDGLNKKSSKYIGNKAANFALLSELSRKHDFKVPESAFAIPFSYYAGHIAKGETQALIEELLLMESKAISRDSLQNQLKLIRRSIKNSPINSKLIDMIEDRISMGSYTRFRFRSSTNAEDAKGFSGAGLYSSKTGILGDPEKSFELAIKEVWASIWSEGAFFERALYGIDHKDAYMGILVHRSFPNELINGVAVTKNMYRPGYFGFVVNAQLGNENVVKPKSGVVNCQFICYPNMADNIYQDRISIDLITRSNLNTEKGLIMSQEEIQTLANQLEFIKRYFHARFSPFSNYDDFALDIEFKLDGVNRQLYIKQARVFND